MNNTFTGVWHIYALIDPQTEAVRYVGWTKSLKSRMQQHTRARQRKDRPGNHRTYWLQSLRAAGLQPQVRVLESGSGNGWADAEIRWIKYFREAGADLVNSTDGGDGLRNYVVSAETRLKLSKAFKGRVIDNETRSKIAEAKRGLKRPPFSDEARKNMSEGGKRKRLTEQHKRRIAEAKKGGTNRLSETGRQRLVESGHRLSDGYNFNRPHCQCEACRNCRRRVRRAAKRGGQNP